MQNLRKIVLILCDVCSMLAAAYLSYAMTADKFILNGMDDFVRPGAILVISGIIFISYFESRGHYNWRTPWWQQVRQVIRPCMIAIMVGLIVNYVSLPSVSARGEWVTISWVLTIPILLSLRWVGRAILKSLNHWDIPTILIGGVQNVTETIYALKSEMYLTYDIKRVVLRNAEENEIYNFDESHNDVEVGNTLDYIIPRSMVILCPEENEPEFLRDAVEKINAAGARLAIVPPTNGFSLYRLQPQTFFGHRIVLLEFRTRLRTFWGRLAKDTLDKTGALLGLVLLSPLFFILIRKIREDGGPAFYSQKRIGKNGKEFSCWKFRSMIVNAENVLKDYLAANPGARAEWDREFKLKDDPRITPVGHFLRRSSLDEIPQLWNVLRGDMSLVGPRPIVEGEKHYYGDKLVDYQSVKPGITGLWQVSGRNDISYEQRVALDSWYVENWSIWNDIVIILKTILVVLYRKGAY